MDRPEWTISRLTNTLSLSEQNHRMYTTQDTESWADMSYLAAEPITNDCEFDFFGRSSSSFQESTMPQVSSSSRKMDQFKDQPSPGLWRDIAIES
eukprot:2886034-Rhodomonas_salina.2